MCLTRGAEGQSRTDTGSPPPVFELCEWRIPIMPINRRVEIGQGLPAVPNGLALAPIDLCHINRRTQRQPCSWPRLAIPAIPAILATPAIHALPPRHLTDARCHDCSRRQSTLPPRRKSAVLAIPALRPRPAALATPVALAIAVPNPRRHRNPQPRHRCVARAPCSSSPPLHAGGRGRSSDRSR